MKQMIRAGVVALLGFGQIVAAESQVLARFDFSNGLNADAVEAGVGAVLESTDYRMASKDTDPSDGAIEDDCFLAANGMLYMNRGSASWGLKNETSPFVLTVSALPGRDVTVKSVTVEWADEHNGFKGQQLLVQVDWQSDGRLVAGSSATFNTRLRTAVIALKEPVLVKAGQSARFLIDLNSGQMDGNHILDSLSVNGTVQPGGTGGQIILGMIGL
jgi:hypothetical protein